MNYELRSGLAAALCFCFLNCSFLLLPCALRAQAPRPPIQNLSGLTGDVNITTPLDLQPLRYDTATSKWINSVTLGDIVIYSSNAGLLTNVADFYNATLMNKTGVAIDWSNIAGTEFPLPLIDGSAAKSIDVNARKLYKPDGTTVLFDWSGSNPKFPTLTNSASNAFLTTDVLGNVSVAPVPNAGIIPATTNLLAGDGAGNAINAGTYAGNSALVELDPTGLFIGSNGDYQTYLSINNADGIHSSTAAEVQINGASALLLKALGNNSTGGGGIRTAGDNTIESLAPNLVVVSPLLKFSNDNASTERFRAGNGLAVGTTTDPGAGVVNVNTGFRIGNAAPYNHSLIGNGTSYVDGSVPGKASVTSTVDQTAITETAHVVYTVPANSAAVGTVYRIHASGNVDNGTTGITFTPRIRWGGLPVGGVQLLATPTFTASTTTNTNRAYELNAYVTIRATGATGTATAEMKYVERSTSTTGVETTHIDNSGTTAVTIDTTANKDLDLTWSLSATTGTPHIRTISGTVEVVRP
jgi:hypothetical protein